MDDFAGFAMIKKDAKTYAGSKLPLSVFTDFPVRVMEFADDGGAMVVNAEGNAAAMFDKEDIVKSFRCGFTPGIGATVLTPPNMDMLGKMAYSMKVTSRKGGYNNLLLNMVILASIHKGELDDRMLFSKQD